MQPEDRGAAVPVSVVDVQEAIARTHNEEWARARRPGGGTAYDRAIELAGNIAEIAYLTRRRNQLG